MHDESVKRQTVAATVGFAIFIVLFTVMRDLLGGQPLNLAGPLLSGVVGAAVFGVIFYTLVRRRSATNGA